MREIVESLKVRSRRTQVKEAKLANGTKAKLKDSLHYIDKDELDDYVYVTGAQLKDIVSEVAKKGSIITYDASAETFMSEDGDDLGMLSPNQYTVVK